MNRHAAITDLFGDDANSPDAELAGVLDAFLADIEAGRPADPERLLAEHPRFADRLRAYLPLIGFVDQRDRAAPSLPRTVSTEPSARSLVARPHPTDPLPTRPDAMRWAGPLAHGPDVTAGLQLGDFRVVREIGRGGMGIVYEAEQISLGRRVALKVLPISAAFDPKLFWRFQVEARAAASLHHTNIVPVFTTGSERGVYFYAMQHIDGQSLHSVIQALRHLEGQADGEAPAKACALPLFRASGAALPAPGRTTRDHGFFDSVASIGIQAAEALDYAHSHGVVHRDIKPANFLIDVGGNLWVTDFGLALVQDGGNLTATGDVVGTLRYMSPEQVLGKRAAVDHRADVYALGATLYELLTLRPAYEGHDRSDLIRRIGSEEPKPPRHPNPAIPRDLETIVLKALAREVGERYASARDLADDLRRFVDHRPIHARRPSLWTRTKRWARRHRPIVAAAALITCIVGLAAGIVATQVRHNHQLRRSILRNQYVKDVRLTSHLLERGRLVEAVQTLERYGPTRGDEDLRGFSWRYLWRVCRFQPRTLAGHRDSPQSTVYHIEFSPDGDTLASCGADGTVRVWDVKSGDQKQVLRGHVGDVNWVTFSPEGSSLATVGDDGTVRVWDLRSEEDPAPTTLGEHDDWVNCVLFTPDGRRLLSGGRDGRVKLWDAAHGRLLASSPTLPRWIEGMSLSPDGRTLATAGADGKVRLWDVDALRERTAFEAHHDGVQSVAFSRSGLDLASAGRDWQLKVWDIAGKAAPAVGQGHRAALQCAAWSRDGRLLATCGDDGTVRVWDAGSLRSVRVYRSEACRLWCVAFSDDGRTLASAGEDGLIRLWDLKACQDRAVVTLPMSAVHSVAFTEPGRLVIAGSAGNGDRSRESVTTLDLHRARLHDTRAMRASRAVGRGMLSADGRALLTYEAGEFVTLWDLDTGSPVKTCKLPQPAAGSYRPFLFSDRQVVMLNIVDNYYRKTLIYDVAKGSHIGIGADVLLPADHEPGRGNSLFFISVPSGAPVRWQPAANRWTEGSRPAAGNTALAIADDGRTIATAHADAAILLWDARTMEYDAPPIDTTVPANRLAFSPNGRLLASLGVDGIVRLWDVATRGELISLDASETVRAGVTHLAFAPDGSALVCCFSATGHGLALIWSVDRGGP